MIHSLQNTGEYIGLRYIAKKIAEAIFLIFIVVTVNFFLIRYMPGDPVEHIIGEEEYLSLQQTNPARIEEIRAYYGLDKPLHQQYTIYLWKTAHLDFGDSFRTNTPVLETVLYRMQWTLALAIPATIIAGLLGGLAGLTAGWKKQGWFDLTASPAFLWILTIPGYCMAILTLIIFAFHFRFFPLGGFTSGGLTGFNKFIDVIWHMLLPVSVLVVSRTASNFMMMKSAVTLIQDEAYISTAVSKGLPEKKVVGLHLLKNVLVPYITSVCMQFGSILGGSMLVEVVFSWRGMGTLIYQSAASKDFPMIQTCFLFTTVCVVAFNLIADILCMFIDPRIKEGLLNE
jgi:peptide/nickel transport system permease protein